MESLEGYNEKYPSGLKKVTFWPPLSMTFTFEALADKPDPFKLKPIKEPSYKS